MEKNVIRDAGWDATGWIMALITFTCTLRMTNTWWLAVLRRYTCSATVRRHGEEPLVLAALTPPSFYSHFIFLLLFSLAPCSFSFFITPPLLLVILPHVLLHLLPCLTKQVDAVWTLTEVTILQSDGKKEKKFLINVSLQMFSQVYLFIVSVWEFV